MRYIFTLLLTFLVVISANAQDFTKQKYNPQSNQINLQMGIAQPITNQKDAKDMVEVPHFDPNPPASYYNVPKSKFEIQIGTEQLTDQRYPVYAFFGYSYTQSIYLASEIGTSGTITKIQYYFNGTSLSNSDQWVVYMGHTTKSTISVTTDWVPIADLTEVFNGTITWAAGNWIEITLTTPFVYNGTDNLVIAVDENKAGYDGISDRFYCSNVTGNRSMIYFNDSNNPDPNSPPEAGYVQAVIPNIILSVTPSITNDHDLSLASINLNDNYPPNTEITPSVKVVNLGLQDEATFDVEFKIFDENNTEVYNQTQTFGPIASLETQILNFTTTYTLAEGYYTCQASVILATDQDISNNNSVKTIIAANSINMQNGTFSTCYGLFYDSGGPNANYANNENFTLTFTPTTSNKKIKVEFTSFDTENNYDSLMIYNSNNTDSGYIGKFMGTNSPGTIIAKNIDGALTFKFKSDYTINKSGWIANVTCLPQLDSDLTVQTIDVPNFINSGSQVTPVIKLFNNGILAQGTWTVTLVSDDNSYTSTKSNLGTINPFSTFDVTMDPWTPAEGNYTLTAVVTLPNDLDNSNDTLQKPVNVMDLVTAFAWDVYHSSGVGVTDEGPINIIVPTGTMSQIAVNTGDFIIGADYVNNDLYGVQYAASGNSPLVQINPTTGVVTTIGGGAPSLTGLAYDATTDTTYVIDYNGVLYTIDLNTGTVTSIGGTYAGAIGLACSPTGDLYAISIISDNIATIDKTTGAATVIGPLGININYAQDIAFDRDNNILYGTLYATTGGLYTLNTTTGAATLVASVIDELAGFAIPFTPSGATITFNVKNESNQPVENAKIVFGQRILYTDNSGQANIFMIPGNINYTVSKYGYQDATGSVTVVDGVNQTVDVTLIALPNYNATITVTNQATTPAPIQNADVTVKYGTQTVATGQTNSNGEFVAQGLIDGNYTIDVTATGFEPYNGTFIVSGAALNITVQMTEIIWEPYGLLAEQLNNEHDVRFYWNNDLGFTDDFESYTAFEYQTIGDYTLYDGDGKASYGFTNYDFPNENYTGSYIIFKPSECTPPLTESDAQPHSGNQYIACFNATSSPWNNDWLITKQITAANGMKFSFWASTFQIYQVGEQFKVGVSTTNTDPGSFAFISPLVTVPIGWTHYEYDLSAYAGQNIYLAINCLSQDEFIFMVDDLAVGMGKKSPMPVVSYSVSLNGDPVASGITTTEYTFQDLEVGDYTFGVKGVFQTGESNEAFLNFTVTGNKELQTRAVIYPNPTSDFVKVQAKGNYNVKVVDVNGRVVLNQNANNTSNLDLRNLPSGVYMLQMTFDQEQTTTRIIKK